MKSIYDNEINSWQWNHYCIHDNAIKTHNKHNEDTILSANKTSKHNFSEFKLLENKLQLNEEENNFFIWTLEY